MANLFHRDVGALVTYYITTAPANFTLPFEGCYEQFKPKCEQLARQYTVDDA